MTIVALERVLFVNPLGDMGDRNIQGQTTIISNEAWLLEADFHHGKIGDVVAYQNKNQHDKGAEPRWEWYAAIPTANIKQYRLAGTLPAPVTLSHGEPQATPAPSPAHAGGSSAKS